MLLMRAAMMKPWWGVHGIEAALCLWVQLLYKLIDKGSADGRDCVGGPAGSTDRAGQPSRSLPGLSTGHGKQYAPSPPDHETLQYSGAGFASMMVMLQSLMVPLPHMLSRDSIKFVIILSAGFQQQ